MPNHGPEATPDKASSPSVDAHWLDLYTLLGVTPEADAVTLRTKIRDAYTQATANLDHRNLERRIHFQTMAERIIPHSRRILLDPSLRERYDQENALHKAGDPAARGFSTFLSGLNTPVLSTADEPDWEGEDQNSIAPHNELAEANPTEPPSTGGKPQTELKVPLQGSDLGRSGTQGSVGEVRLHRVAGDLQSVSGTPAAGPDNRLPSAADSASTAPAAPARQPVVGGTTPPAPPPSPGPSPAGQLAEEEGQLFASVLRPEGPSESQHSTVRFDHGGGTSPARAPRVRTASRISLGEDELSRRAAGNLSGRGKRLVGHTTQLLATAVCAALLTLYILHANDDKTAAGRIAVRIAYSSDLQGFMESARRQFAETDSGKFIDLDLRPMDSRAAMGAILSGGAQVDAWIPSESLWSDRFNDVAGSKKVVPITVARSMALSPCVLIARSDHTAALHKFFPNGTISSWDALRTAISRGCAGHFGLTDPTRSGSGAVARYFMAREWCGRHGVARNESGTRDPQLWAWLAGFEDNVPGSARLSEDMVKELALGTADRYWWALAYESEAIAWLNAGKKVDVFYLPQTSYADHPLCFIDRGHAPEAATAARGLFERFVRSTQIQKVLVQAGLRPTEIEPASIADGNPFTGRYHSHGIRKSGFSAEKRINYRILNALNAAWASRNS